MQDERWLRVFCQDLHVYDEQQAREGWTRSERDAWIASMIADARPELRRRGHSWGAFLDALERELARLRELAPATEDGVGFRASVAPAELIVDPAEAERLARGLVAELLQAQLPELPEVEVRRARFRFARRVTDAIAASDLFERTLDEQLARKLA
jgi:hypothetical protein